MRAFSEGLSSIAVSLIQEFGEPCTFLRSVKGSYNVSTATATQDSTVTFSSNCFPESYTASEIDETNIQRGDTKLLVGEISTGETPTVGDQITFSSRAYRIINVEETKVNAETVLYTIQCRA